MMRYQLDYELSLRLGGQSTSGRYLKKTDFAYALYASPDTGPRKGSIAKVTCVYSSHLTLTFDDGHEKDFHYSKCTVVDQTGKPIEWVITDMSARPIQIDSVIVYSVSAGNSSHALEIGRVKQISATGAISVDVLIHNGEPPSRKRYGGTMQRASLKSHRVLLLPVDVSQLTLWVLGNFENFQNFVED